MAVFQKGKNWRIDHHDKGQWRRKRHLKPDEINALLPACSEHLGYPVITVINSKNNKSRGIPIDKTPYDELLPNEGTQRWAYLLQPVRSAV
jgi:hypothetical protein